MCAKTMFNKEIRESFDGIVDIRGGSLQTLTDVDDNMYLSFYTNSLLWSCGYNNPNINRDINATVKNYQQENKPLEIDELLNDLEKQLHPHLPKKLSVVRFGSVSPYGALLQALLKKRGKTEFLCLEKTEGLFPKDFQDKIQPLEACIADDPNVNIDAIKNTVFPELETLRLILKKRRGTLAGFIVNPVITSDASLAQKEHLGPLLTMLQKLNIPIIWDDSTAGFYRTGMPFSYRLYDFQPDVLIYNGLLYGHRSVHFVAVSKKINKLFDTPKSAILPEDAPNYIILKVLLNHMEAADLTKKIPALSTRMLGKLRALEANCNRKFSIKGKGMLIFMDLKNEKVCRSFVLFMKSKGILVKQSATLPQFILFYPPLIVDEKNIDEIVENIKRFFVHPTR